MCLLCSCTCCFRLCCNRVCIDTRNIHSSFDLRRHISESHRSHRHWTWWYYRWNSGFWWHTFSSFIKDREIEVFVDNLAFFLHRIKLELRFQLVDIIFCYWVHLTLRVHLFWIVRSGLWRLETWGTVLDQGNDVVVRIFIRAIVKFSRLWKFYPTSYFWSLRCRDWLLRSNNLVRLLFYSLWRRMLNTWQFLRNGSVSLSSSNHSLSPQF